MRKREEEGIKEEEGVEETWEKSDSKGKKKVGVAFGKLEIQEMGFSGNEG